MERLVYFGFTVAFYLFGFGVDTGVDRHGLIIISRSILFIMVILFFRSFSIFLF